MQIFQSSKLTSCSDVKFVHSISKLPQNLNCLQCVPQSLVKTCKTGFLGFPESAINNKPTAYPGTRFLVSFDSVAWSCYCYQLRLDVLFEKFISFREPITALTKLILQDCQGWKNMEAKIRPSKAKKHSIARNITFPLNICVGWKRYL